MKSVPKSVPTSKTGLTSSPDREISPYTGGRGGSPALPYIETREAAPRLRKMAILEVGTKVGARLGGNTI
jgi:hypothetical protein